MLRLKALEQFAEATTPLNSLQTLAAKTPANLHVEIQSSYTAVRTSFRCQIRVVLWL
mgnify:CR=1 FL=1